MSGFLIEIDGKEQAFDEDVDNAKQVALSLAKGVSSIMIKSANLNNVPMIGMRDVHENMKREMSNESSDS